MAEDDQWSSTGFCAGNCCLQFLHEQHSKVGDSSDMEEFADDSKIFKLAKMNTDWKAENGFVVNW